MARHIAKNIVAANLASSVTVQIAYAIGVAEPVSVLVDSHGTGSVPDAQLEAAARSRSTRCARPHPVRYHRVAATASPNLSADGCLWALRAREIFLGTNRYGTAPARSAYLRKGLSLRGIPFR